LQTPVITPTQALEKLMLGNRRYAAMRQIHPRQTSDHRNTLLEGQHPFAAILSCSDSRVPSELIFDQGLGDLFIVRTAGHAVNDLVLASIEFAVHALQVPLVMVLGHSQCGAVSSAIKGGAMPGNIARLVESFQPAVAAVQGHEGDMLENAIRANARLFAARIQATSTIIGEAVAQDRARVVPAFYDLSTGHVEVLT
jgi:carbonic anhydrase